MARPRTRTRKHKGKEKSVNVRVVVRCRYVYMYMCICVCIFVCVHVCVSTCYLMFVPLWLTHARRPPLHYEINDKIVVKCMPQLSQIAVHTSSYGTSLYMYMCVYMCMCVCVCVCVCVCRLLFYSQQRGKLDNNIGWSLSRSHTHNTTHIHTRVQEIV